MHAGDVQSSYATQLGKAARRDAYGLRFRSFWRASMTSRGRRRRRAGQSEHCSSWIPSCTYARTCWSMYGAAVWGFYCGVNKTTDENGLRAGGRGRADSFWRVHATYLMTARHGRRPAADTRRRGTSAPAPRVRRPAGRSGLPAPCSLQCNIDAMRLVRASPARSCLARAARQAWQARGEASRPGSRR